MKREILIIVVTTILTALIVGYGVYVWKQPIDDAPKSPIKMFNASVIIDGE